MANEGPVIVNIHRELIIREINKILRNSNYDFVEALLKQLNRASKIIREKQQ